MEFSKNLEDTLLNDINNEWSKNDILKHIPDTYYNELGGLLFPPTHPKEFLKKKKKILK